MPKINPWDSKAVFDYEHVFKEFGLKRFPEVWKKKLKHRLFERNLVIAHRDFEKVFERIQKKKSFINVTGIASSGHYHLGHKVDIDLFVFFKECGAKNYFAVTDLDAYTSREDSKVSSLKKAKEFAVENVADALALGLSEKDVFVQSNKETRYYEFAFELSKKITGSTFKAVYGHIDVGKVAANLLQYADILHPQLSEFEGKMPSVTGIGLDQDPHARLTRDIAKRLPYSLEVPSFIYFQHQSGLQEGKKMSSSEPATAIFLNDKLKDAERKVLNAFTGGRPTVEEQRKHGGKPEICKAHELLKFHYPDTKEVERIFRECKEGKWLCGDCKKFTAAFITHFLKEHQKKAASKRKTAEKIVFERKK